MSSERKDRTTMIATDYKISRSGMAWKLDNKNNKRRERKQNKTQKRNEIESYEFLHSPGRNISKPIGTCPSVFGMTLLDCRSRNLVLPSIHSRLVASSIIRDKNRVCQLSMLAMKAATTELLATTQRRNNISYKRRVSKAMVGVPFMKPGKVMYRDSDNIINYANENGDIQCMIYPNNLPKHGSIPSHISSKELQLLGDVNIKTVLNRLQSSFVVRYHVSTVPAIAYRCERRWRASIAWLRRLKDEEHRLQVARYDAAMVNMAYTRAAFEKINKVIIAHIETKKLEKIKAKRAKMRKNYTATTTTTEDTELWERLHPKTIEEATKLDTAAKTIQRMFYTSRIRHREVRPGTGEPPHTLRFVRKDISVDVHRLDYNEGSGIGLTPAGSESESERHVHFQESFDSEYIESCGDSE